MDKVAMMTDAASGYMTREVATKLARTLTIGFAALEQGKADRMQLFAFAVGQIKTRELVVSDRAAAAATVVQAWCGSERFDA